MTTRQNFQNWELDKLSDYIVDKHHVYVREVSPKILDMANRVSEDQGGNHPELIEITKTFETLSKAMEDHMVGEEKYLFPYIKKMLVAKNSGDKLPIPGFGSLDVPLKNHYEDHDHADSLMKKIREMSKEFALPSDASETYKAFYEHLKEYEADLKQHICVENEVLFGRSIELEKEVVG